MHKNLGSEALASQSVSTFQDVGILGGTEVPLPKRGGI